MSLQKQIIKDTTKALKAKDKPRLKALRLLGSAIKNKEIELRPKPLTENHFFGILRKQIKQAEEALLYYEKAGREESVQEEKSQISVWKSYLPPALSEKEITSIVRQNIKQLKASSLKDMAQVVKAVMAQAKGSVEGKKLAQIVREELSKL